MVELQEGAMEAVGRWQNSKGQVIPLHFIASLPAAADKLLARFVVEEDASVGFGGDGVVLVCARSSVLLRDKRSVACRVMLPSRRLLELMGA